MADDPDGDGGQWLTILEIAEVRGISEQSAGRTIRRKKWRRQPDNQGTVRYLVPDAGRTKEPVRRNNADMVAGLLSTIEILREQLKREAARADSTESELSAAHDAVERAQREAQDARGRLDELTKAHFEAGKGRGLLARLMAAWRGE